MWIRSQRESITDYIGVVVLMIGIFIFKSTGGGTYSVVKAVSFDDFGPETIGEVVDENIKSPEWSQKKLDGSSKLVYVENISWLMVKPSGLNFILKN